LPLLALGLLFILPACGPTLGDDATRDDDDTSPADDDVGDVSDRSQPADLPASMGRSDEDRLAVGGAAGRFLTLIVTGRYYRRGRAW
jgi:hypothetical protein